MRFTQEDELRGAEFDGADLRDARFVGVDLSGAVIRGSEVLRVEIDSPWLFDGETFLRVNGVDVLPFVNAELDRRFPGRAERFAKDPDGLRNAWSTLERAWTPVLERTATMPAGTVDVRIDGEWSFAQTLRHLVIATDIWLNKAIRRLDDPFHPVGLLHSVTVETADPPPYEEVLEVRAGRVAMVRDFLATVTPEVLDEPRANPHNPQHEMTVRLCLHTILEEEWEHLRYAVRDLDAIDRR
jgi:hypothetical protein